MKYLLKTLAAHIFILTFATAMLVPWQDIFITCKRETPERIYCSIEEHFFLDIHVRKAEAIDVINADYKVNHSSHNNRSTTTSLVALIDRQGKPTAISSLSSNFDSERKGQLLKELRAFIRSSESHYETHLEYRYWFSYVGLALWVMGLSGLPWTIRNIIRGHN
jgi:hypothetical protein